ncbi:DUF4013 domain-containing protein [Natronomonas sp. EA1]|uniref:DUF4013 domain-containing protein n=1 Tax=Natronomonas sp. EA1 TaxID=3421655 RepID=UPI003EBD697D
MFETAINYPRQGEKPWMTILIGGLLSLFSFLIIPAFIVLGYTIRVLRHTMEGEEAPPRFAEWGALLVDGLKAFVVLLAYFIVPAIIVGLSVGGVALAAITGGEPSLAALGGAFIGLSVAGLLALALWYVAPAGLANFAKTGSLSAAFAVGELKQAAFSASYAKHWALALVVLLIAGALAGALAATGIGAILGVFVEFYALVVAYYLYARGFDAAMAFEETEAVTGQPAA